jgi:F-box/leucine-rich repeat protein 2/20
MKGHNREWDAMSVAPTEVGLDQSDVMECTELGDTRANLALLDADAVAHLATFLPLRDLLTASCVCADWQRSFAACVTSICVSNVALGSVSFPSALTQLAARFPSVMALRLHGSNVTDLQVRAAAELFPALTELDLSQCDNVSNDALGCMAAILRGGLRTLNVLGCRDITNDGIRRLGGSCAELVSLCLGWCHISDNALLVLSKQCTLLEELDVSGCGRISDAGVTAVTSGCRRLSKLSIEGCREVSAWAVAAGAAPLTSLNLGGCTLVTDAGVGAIAAAHPRLRALSLRLCRSVGDVALRFLAMRCPQLQSLDISR